MTIDRDKRSINLNENMDALVPASKISDMATGWICGQTARDFTKTKTGTGGSMNIQESEEFKTTKFFCKTNFDMKEIKKEEAGYVPAKVLYTSSQEMNGSASCTRICASRAGCQGNDKGRAEQAWGEIEVGFRYESNKNVKHLQYSRYYCRYFYIFTLS